MATAKDVAAYMTFELKRRGGELYHNDIAEWILRRFGREYVSQGQDCSLKIREDVRREFRAMNPDVVWKTRAGLTDVWHVRKPGPRDQNKDSTK